MSNLSKIRRDKMIEFLETLKEQHGDDESLIAINQIEKELLSKRYGLVWEEHEEAVDVMMRDNIPVFTETKEREICMMPGEDYNFLLEGDNLHSLHLLEKTHRGKVDVIYIDPPYNTGGKDFVYNDTCIDRTDGYRHSKWLSFMYERLVIAKKLMSDIGLIFISIDDNEVAQLKLLCNEIFGEENFRGQIARGTGTPTGQGNAILSNEIDYILVYAKTQQAFFNGLPFDDESSKIYNLEDEYGKYLNRPLRKTGGEDRREDRPSMFYPIKAPDGTDIYPIAPSGYESRWRCQKSTYEQLCKEHRIEWKRDESGWKIYQKFYLEGRTKQPGNLWSNVEGNKKATITIKNIMGTSGFSFPKPVEVIVRILQIAGNKDSVVLDFFAGSGTTAQAVLELNKEDGGQRKFILCTNNENNICEEITYQRIKTVITGKRQDGSEYSEGIPANLKYYHTDFVPKSEEYLADSLLNHVTEMIQLEHGVRIDDDSYIMIMSDDEADELEKKWNEYTDIKAIYLSQDVLLTASQEALFGSVDTYIIPDYYFNFELREAGELW